MNKTIILGTITKDIELKYTQSGTAIANFSIAYNKKWTDKHTNERKEKASFFDVQVFGKQAETVNQYFHKGSRILVEGELEQQTWQAQDGTNRSKIVINLNGFDFIDKSNNSGANQAPQQGSYGQYQQPQQQNYQTNQPQQYQPTGNTQPPPQQYQQPQSAPQSNPQQTLSEVDIDDSEIPF